MKTLALIDANSFIHRAYHALPPLTTPDGRPIQAIYGIASILLKLTKEYAPDYAAALFDRPEPTFRDKEYKEYKAQRPQAPDELIAQIIEARNLFDAFGIAGFELAGYEADDLIATLATRFAGEGVRVMIFTGDRDAFQLVEGDRTVVVMPKRGLSDTVLYDEARVKEEFGLFPKELIDYKALVGDSSDNIKGVPGVGPKTAQKLITDYDTLENLYATMDEKLKARLEPYRDAAFLAKRLVALMKDAPLEIANIETLKFHIEEDRLAAYFKKMGFETLTKRIGNHEEPKPEPIQKGMF